MELDAGEGDFSLLLEALSPLESFFDCELVLDSEELLDSEEDFAPFSDLESPLPLRA